MSTPPQRWTVATVYPDMWVDPADDPRNTEGLSPDGESATLLDYIHDYRLTLAMKCRGLTLDQMMTLSVPPSTMSLLGLVRHMTEVERDWRNWISDGDREPAIYGGLDAAFDLSGLVSQPGAAQSNTSAAGAPQFGTARSGAAHNNGAQSDGEDIEDPLITEAFDRLEQEQTATDAVVDRHEDLGTHLGRVGIAVRELQVHRIEEYARHCGHADLLRECIDGRTGQ
ncbi:mycothiol transferase [Brevibacterium oceani]|uniref:mycothiol transferase n=1 Tax=Brevibacterium oceani TaxID=358099 RepID=UPI0015E6DB2A|nr:DUF664 domain-containing protein [Brevibacterium oceani]